MAGPWPEEGPTQPGLPGSCPQPLSLPAPVLSHPASQLSSPSSAPQLPAHSLSLPDSKPPFSVPSSLPTSFLSPHHPPHPRPSNLQPWFLICEPNAAIRPKAPVRLAQEDITAGVGSGRRAEPVGGDPQMWLSGQMDCGKAAAPAWPRKGPFWLLGPPSLPVLLCPGLIGPRPTGPGRSYCKPSVLPRSRPDRVAAPRPPAAPAGGWAQSF